MAPRKKTNSAAKKSSFNQNNQQSQPSKFGIQHFFERHSQNQSQNPKKPTNSPNPNPSNSSNAAVAENPQIDPKYRNEDPSNRPDSGNLDFLPDKHVNGSDLRGLGTKNDGLSCGNLRNEVNLGVVGAKKLENERNKEGNGMNNPSQIMSTDNQLPVVNDVDENQEEVQEVSPEVYKGKPPKRFKFSPGMVVVL